MGHDHSHGIQPWATATAAHRRGLVIALTVTVSVMILETIGAVISGSLALLADAGHMLTDSAGIGLALFASWLATRPATATRTFGWLRAEILAALINGLLLTVICVTVLIEGVQRLNNPPEQIMSTLMLWVAVVGLAANLISLFALRGGQRESLNVRGAYLEVMGDAIGSVFVIIAALVVMRTGWTQADALASIGIAVFIAPRAYVLLRDVFHVLLEAAPVNMNMAEVRAHMENTSGVVQVHDLHAWTITSGMPVLSAHVVVAADVDPLETLKLLKECLTGHFDVEHCTFQIESEQIACAEEHLHQ